MIVGPLFSQGELSFLLDRNKVAVTQERLRVATPQDIVSAFDAEIRARIERVEHIPSLAYRLAMVADGRIDGTLVKKNAHDE